MCTVLLPPGVNPIAVNKYIIPYMFFWVCPRRQCIICRRFGTMCQFNLQRLEVYCLLPAFEDGTDTWFRNVGILYIDAGDIPKRTYTIFTSRRKLEIYKYHIVSYIVIRLAALIYVLQSFWTACRLKTGQICYPATSVTSCQPTPHNIPEEQDLCSNMHTQFPLTDDECDRNIN